MKKGADSEFRRKSPNEYLGIVLDQPGEIVVIVTMMSENQSIKIRESTPRVHVAGRWKTARRFRVS
jgi:hypothetical protein